MATKGVIFDMDGVITFSEPLHFQAYTEVLKKFGVTDYTFDEHMKQYAGSGSQKIFSGVLESRGISVTQDDIDRCAVEKADLYKKLLAATRLELVPGIHALLDLLDRRGIPHIVASGTSQENIRAVLTNAEIGERFPLVISVRDVPQPKPAPDVFLKAADILDLRPDECVVIEDAVNGVIAAKKAGIRCIALETTTPKDALLAAGADIVVKDHTEITEQLLFGTPRSGG